MTLRGLLIDLDGTLYLQGRAIDGAIAAVRELRGEGYSLRFLTNTSAALPDEIAARLSQMGFSIAAEDLFTPVQAALGYLARRKPQKCLFLVSPAILPSFAGWPSAPDDADVIVMGDMGAGFTFDVLNRAFLRMRAGAELVVLQRNPFWLAPQGPQLDCGAFTAALEFATGRSGVVVGKPSPTFFELARASTGLAAEEVLVVGDDLTTDIAGAGECGLRSVLLRTGKFREHALATAAVRPDAVLDSIADVPPWLKSHRPNP
jgi:HAD superfamily hydrolase (TIGR01458 family)